MKKINIPTSMSFQVTFKHGAFPDQISYNDDELTEIKCHTNDVHKFTQIATANSGQVLYATSVLFNGIENIISDYLFGLQTEPSKQKNLFKSQILSSPQLTTSFKKQIIEKIVNEEGFLKSKNKDRFFKNLKKILSVRNALAHGELVMNPDQSLTLKYFENGHREVKISDIYWNDIKEVFKYTFSFLEEINKNMETVVNRVN